MRPDVLNPLFADISSLPGVGPRVKKAFERLAGGRVIDLCWHLPSGVVDRRYRPKLEEAEPGRVATLKLKVMAHQRPASPRAPWKVLCTDGQQDMDLTFFRANGRWLEKQLPLGEWRLVSGRLEIFNGRFQMSHPDHMVPPDEAESLPQTEALYPLTAGLGQKVVQKAVGPRLNGHRRFRVAGPVPSEEPSAELAPSPARVHQPQRRRIAPCSRAATSGLRRVTGRPTGLSLIRLNQRAAGRPLRGDGRLSRLPAPPFRSPLAAVGTGGNPADMASSDRMLRRCKDVGMARQWWRFMTAVEAVSKPRSWPPQRSWRDSIRPSYR